MAIDSKHELVNGRASAGQVVLLVECARSPLLFVVWILIQIRLRWRIDLVNSLGNLEKLVTRRGLFHLWQYDGTG